MPTELTHVTMLIQLARLDAYKYINKLQVLLYNQQYILHRVHLGKQTESCAGL